MFIDEAQDTDAFQWDLLKKAFNSDGELSIRQGFGDSNQAIYGNLYVDDTMGNFPRENALVLSESRLFDSSISILILLWEITIVVKQHSWKQYSCCSLNHS